MPESATYREMDQVSVKSIGFIEKGTGMHQSNMVYGADGISPCLNAVNYKEPYKILEIEKCAK